MQRGDLRLGILSSVELRRLTERAGGEVVANYQEIDLEQILTLAGGPLCER